MNKILIVDFSTQGNELGNIFKKKSYDVHICESAFDAISKLKAYDFDLVISEVELPGDNAFELYNYIQLNYPYIPTIMTTDKDIDSFFDQIFQEGIGNVLSKPINENEILKLSEKLITKENTFGLSNYMDEISIQKKIRITNSKQIRSAIKIILDQIKEWEFEIENRSVLNLVLNEMAINAIYHSHGLTKEKEERKPVKLNDGDYVDLHFARNENKYGIAITDYNGILTKDRILTSINSVVEQDTILQKALETGEDITDLISETGRGIDLTRKLTGEYYFIIKKDFRTEITLIFDKNFSKDSKQYSSLKIIEH